MDTTLVRLAMPHLMLALAICGIISSDFVTLLAPISQCLIKLCRSEQHILQTLSYFLRVNGLLAHRPMRGKLRPKQRS